MNQSKKAERGRQFYDQAAKAYVKGRVDFFASAFTVPIENLYNTVCDLGRDDVRRRNFRLIFDARVKSMIEDKKPFDFEYLSSDILKTIRELPVKKYEVYFGVPIKKSNTTPLPFGNIFKLDSILFKSISQKQFERAHKKDCLDEYYRHNKKSLDFGDDLNRVVQGFHYFRASADATDDTSAANMVANAFETLYVCAVVAQERGALRHTMGSTNTKSRTPIQPAGILMVSSDHHAQCELLWGTDIRMRSDESLTFTTDKTKMNSFNSYKRICHEETPISKRIRLVLFEFARALHATDPHIRQLGLWRTLEIATSKAGSSRPEKEIVQILGNYYKETPHWVQQGDLIKEQRNLFVHQGAILERDSWGSVDKYLNWSHEYVRDTISILLWMRKNKIGLKSSDIDDFFDLYVKSDRTLEIGAKLLNGRAKKPS